MDRAGRGEGWRGGGQRMEVGRGKGWCRNGQRMATHVVRAVGADTTTAIGDGRRWAWQGRGRAWTKDEPVRSFHVKWLGRVRLRRQVEGRLDSTCCRSEWLDRVRLGRQVEGRHKSTCCLDIDLPSSLLLHRHVIGHDRPCACSGYGRVCMADVWLRY